MQAAVADAKRVFPNLPGEADWNLAISHRKRKHICKRINDAQSAGKLRFLAPAAKEETSQNIWVFEGAVLVGCTKHKWVRNGGFYKVLCFTSQDTTFEDMDAPGETEPPEARAQSAQPDSETESETESEDARSENTQSTQSTQSQMRTLTLNNDEITRCLRIAACLTYSACQSRTLPGRLRLWDVGHVHFTKRHLNVGLSRGTSCSLIDLCE